MKIDTNELGHMTNMAAMPIYCIRGNFRGFKFSRFWVKICTLIFAVFNFRGHR